MRQVLHIFRKDCQQFWPEITATLAITACFVWLYPNQWTTWQDATVPRGNSLLDLHHMQILANTVTALVPVSWFFLIARIVHGENLIGNRQFWLTRPYRWQSLLAEKFLFILIFLYLPFLVGQVCLLGRAGFSPWTYLPGMLFNLLLLTGVMVLPLMGFAATVSTLLRMILILLGIVLLIVILAFFAGGFDENPSLQTPFSDRLSIPLILLFCGAALVIQYATRRAWLARGVLLGLVPLIALVAGNPFELPMFKQAYPLSVDQAKEPIQAGLSESDDDGVTVSAGDRKHVVFHIPIALSGLRTGQDVQPDDVQISVDAPDGRHAVSVWQAVYNQHYLADVSEGTVDVTMDRTEFTKVQGQSVKIRVALALTQLAAQASTQTPVYLGRNTYVPGFGICVFDPVQNFSGEGIACRFALHHPLLTQVTARISVSSCAAAPEDREIGRTVSVWEGGVEEDPADFGLTSVWTSDLTFPGTSRYTMNHAEPAHLCPDAPILFTQYRLVRRFRYQFDVAGIRLPKFSNTTALS